MNLFFLFDLLHLRLDRIAELAIEPYLTANEYELLVGNVTQATSLLLELNGIIASVDVQQNDEAGPWEQLGDALEAFGRLIANDSGARQW